MSYNKTLLAINHQPVRYRSVSEWVCICIHAS